MVVAFHSLEDRIVKRFMARSAGRGAGASRHDPASLGPAAAERGPGAAATDAGFRLLTPRALRPGAGETEANPRARSARLRAIERLAPQDAAA